MRSTDYQFGKPDEYNRAELEKAANEYDVDITDNGHVVTLSGSDKDVKKLLSEPRDTDLGRAPVRTLLGEQY